MAAPGPQPRAFSRASKDVYWGLLARGSTEGRQNQSETGPATRFGKNGRTLAELGRRPARVPWASVPNAVRAHETAPPRPCHDCRCWTRPPAEQWRRRRIPPKLPPAGSHRPSTSTSRNHLRLSLSPPGSLIARVSLLFHSSRLVAPRSFFRDRVSGSCECQHKPA